MRQSLRQWFIIVSIILIAVLGAIWMPLDRKMARQLQKMRLAPPPGTPGVRTYTWEEKIQAYRRRVIINSSFLVAITLVIIFGIGWPSVYFNRQTVLTYTPPQPRPPPAGAAWQYAFTGEVGLGFVPGTDTAIVVNTQVHFVHIYFITAAGQMWQTELPQDSYPAITVVAARGGTLVGVRSGPRSFTLQLGPDGQVAGEQDGLPSGGSAVAISFNGTAAGEHLQCRATYRSGFWVGALGNTLVTAVPK